MTISNTALFPEGYTYGIGDSLDCTFQRAPDNFRWQVRVVECATGQILHVTRPFESRFDAYATANAWCDTFLAGQEGAEPCPQTT